MFVWFSLLSVCFIRRGIDYDGISWGLFVRAGIIIVMSFRGSIGSGICMWVLVSESAQVYDLLLLCVLSFKMIITTRMIRKRVCWCLFVRIRSGWANVVRFLSMMNVLLMMVFIGFMCSMNAVVVCSWCGFSWFVHYECDYCEQCGILCVFMGL